jgi:hypothetical protein
MPHNTNHILQSWQYRSFFLLCGKADFFLWELCMEFFSLLQYRCLILNKLALYPRVATNFLFRYKKISHDNIYVIIIWKISINTRLITISIIDTTSDIISHDFSQPLFSFLLYGKEVERNIK